jgi:tRNA G18 (ribose-2'-O)-methylase SpoU
LTDFSTLRRAEKVAMARVAITDLDDPRIAIYRSLKATNATRDMGQFVVEGEKLVARLIASRFATVSVLVTDRHLTRLGVQVPVDVPTYVVPNALIDSIVGFPFHRGVLGCGERRTWPALNEIVARAGPRLTLVVCPRLSNPENLGAIARISDVFGIDAILAGPSCPDALSRRVLRVSMGSSLRVPVIVSEQLGEISDNLVRHDRVVLLGAVADPAAEPFDAVGRPDRLGLVLGEEDQGIEPEWLEKCARRITIPMRPGAASLNVAVAAGIVLHAFRRA